MCWGEGGKRGGGLGVTMWQCFRGSQPGRRSECRGGQPLGRGALCTLWRPWACCELLDGVYSEKVE